MNVQANELLATALTLSESERAEIAARLIESLDPVVDEGAAAAWAEEIERRLKAIDAGEVEMIPWEDVLRELQSPNDG